ncbi:hypothetical protein K469DRAFT_744109 [Zopfia rhizophila CBS 207.26]|uniref:Uncharacterized protein n=1 Tax=Zopfia rhizophila CBS 207.26 TaxID=1314779 RepID=A0A6A6EZJ1_9PEZI|nr:hypothetical protein K469DRAFT_744109 [Zopfia rhizophila CBS 207.26]
MMESSIERLVPSQIFGTIVVSFLMQMISASPAPAHALITSAPILERRDFPSNFVGYALGLNDELETWTCRSSWFYSVDSSTYGACCPPSGICSFGRKCSGDYVIYADGESLSCSMFCRTGFVFYSTDDINPVSMIDCGSTKADLTILRTEFNDLSTPEHLTFTREVTRTIEPTTAITTTPTSTSTGTATPPPAPSTKKTNIAPIVGGVVGGIFVFLGLAVLGFFLYKRRQTKPHHPIQYPYQANAPNPGGSAPSGGDQPVLIPNSPPPPFSTANSPPVQQAGYFPPPEKTAAITSGQPMIHSPVQGQAQSPIISPVQSPIPQGGYQMPHVQSPAPTTPLPVYANELPAQQVQRPNELA